MAIKINPAIQNSLKTSFGNEEKLSTENSSNNNLITNSTAEQKNKITPKDVIAKTAYTWVNFSEGIKGVAKGVFYGIVSGAAVAAVNTIFSGVRKFKNKQIKFLQIFNPKKAMSKVGKTLAFVTAGIVFAGNLIIAKLRANLKTADVDHMLYTGHREE